MNQKLVKIFNEIADILAADRVEFKPFAYRKAARSIADMGEDIGQVYARGGLRALEEIPGIGESIGEKIEEYIKTGKIIVYEKLKRRLPVNWEELTAVQGVGPKRAKLLYQKLGVKDLAGLESAARAHQIAGLAGFGSKSEQNIIEGVEFRKKSRGRFLLGEILPAALAVKSGLEKIEALEKVEFAGSLRRRKETIGDVDILAVPVPKLKPPFWDGAQGTRRQGGMLPKAGNVGSGTMIFFTSMPGVEKIWSKGDTKSSVRMKDGFNMDLRILPPESYGAALQYFTGSKEHNIALRRLAQERGYKLSEYGLFYGNNLIAGRDEEGVYEKLGLQFIPPEMRENTGEIEAAAAGKLPEIIGYGDLRGDLHCHSNYSDGKNTIAEIARAAMDMGYGYVGIADHTKALKFINNMDEAAVEKRNFEIDKLNDRLKKEGKNFTILKGCEANILDDGSIDIADEVLAKLDFAIAGIHTNFHFDGVKMTARIVRAMENSNIDIISHLTGRLLNEREPYALDMEKIFAAAKKTGTILEINANARRLDLNDIHIRRARDMGVKMIINTDAHRVADLQFAQLGIAQARRGWAEAGNIINTYPLEKMKLFFLEKGGKKG